MKLFRPWVPASVILALGTVAQSQDAAPQPTPAPSPVPAVPLAPAGAKAEPKDLMEELSDASFEFPPVSTRRPLSRKADPTKQPVNPHWQTFKDKPDEDGGKVIAGLTTEKSRTGRQALFVQFEKATKKNVGVVLSTNLLSILPGESYRIGIFGRVDAKDPIALDTRLPYLRLRVDWFRNDPEAEGQFEQVGDNEQRVQPIPGSKNRPPMFVANRWSEYFGKFEAPPEAAFVKVTWTWMTSQDDGETNGVIYFDDASVVGRPGPKEDVFADDEALQREIAAEAENPDAVKPTDLNPAGKAIPVVPLTPTPESAQKPK